MTTGFVGLGSMGRHMASRLLRADTALVVNDVNPASVEALQRQGARPAASPRAVADEAGIIFCSLPTPDVVDQVIFGEDGLCHGSAVRTIVDLSTTGPRMSERIGDALRERGIAFVDAPVSGGTSGAEAGTLTLMISGDGAAIDAVMPSLRHIGSNLFVVGDKAGQGQTVKLANNMLFASNLVGAYEATALAVAGGVAPERLLEVINASSGRSYVTEKRIDPPVLDRDFAVRFATGLLRKDVKLALQEAEASGALLFVARAAAQFLDIAKAEGMADEDYTALIRLFERWNGAEVRRSRTEAL
ncbi:NAD(P)-dependent oxidoreductase [Tardibacter chloracetimidivorans]|uniref:NAD(P)-dependent oxidoreductase n=1 Tax=Tardibacter chloracetimidivorans TaxID=1921510 RepID=UPI001300F174|nr:NAD(P)-dependent oxidoreductase [Tardibacter chloracetimidivorans]